MIISYLGTVFIVQLDIEKHASVATRVKETSLTLSYQHVVIVPKVNKAAQISTNDGLISNAIYVSVLHSSSNANPTTNLDQKSPLRRAAWTCNILDTKESILVTYSNFLC